jgi:HEAT repeat protein
MANDRAVHPAVRRLLKHESADVRRQALRLLARAADMSVRHDVERLLYDHHLEVRTEALLYLAEHAHIDPLERIEKLGEFPDFSIRAAMVAFLARPGPAQKLDAAKAILAAMVAETDEKGARVRLEAARLIAILPEVFDRELRTLLQDPDPEVAEAAIRAVARLRKRPFIPRVIDRLAEPRLTEEAVAALASFGDAIVGMLRDAVTDERLPITTRRELPGVLQAIGTRSSHFALVESVLDSDPEMRTRVITALNKLEQQHPHCRLDRNTLESLLMAEVIGHYRSYQLIAANRGTADGLRQEAERIFRLLKMMYPDHDMHSAFVGLVSDDPIVQDNAIEFLEAVLSPPLRAQIIPLFDRNVSLRERGRLASRIVGAPAVTAG